MLRRGGRSGVVGVFIPRLLPKEQVAAGLALNRVSFTTMMLVGPALGGLLIGWAGIGACYLVDALTFVLGFYGAFGLPALPPEGEPSRGGLHGVLDGLRFVAGHRVVRGALLIDLAATVLAMPMSLFPLVNSERFGVIRAPWACSCRRSRSAGSRRPCSPAR